MLQLLFVLGMQAALLSAGPVLVREAGSPGGQTTPGDPGDPDESGGARAGNGPAEFAHSVVRLGDEDTRIALRDIDGDGRQDLVFFEAAGLGVRYLREDGRYPDEHDTFLTWDGDRLAYCLVDIDGDGAIEIAVLFEGREIRVFRPAEDRQLGAFEVLLEAPGDLPHGVVRMRFFRDVDGDGRLDVVLPESGHFAIHRRKADGGFDEPIQVLLQANIRHQVGHPDELGARFGQSIRIPWFRLEDVDGDGRLDLVAETANQVLFHISTEAGLSAESTWRLDLEALRGQESTDDAIDFDDLLSLAAHGATWRVTDLDGEGAAELLTYVAGKFRIYRGGSRTGPVGAPDQVLKSSGNVLLFFLRDVDGDGLADLQILRAGKLSVASAVRWLILPGKLDFELFTYHNESGTFSKKPTRRNVIGFRFPRLFAFISRMEKRSEDMALLTVAPARRAALGGDGEPNDVLDVVGGELLIYHDRAPEEEHRDLPDLDEDDPEDFIEAFILRELDAAGDGATKTLDLGDLDEWSQSADLGLREACAGFVPDVRQKLAPGVVLPTIHVRDLDGDGHKDVIVVGHEQDGTYVVQFLVH